MNNRLDNDPFEGETLNEDLLNKINSLSRMQSYDTFLYKNSDQLTIQEKREQENMRQSIVAHTQWIENLDTTTMPRTIDYANFIRILMEASGISGKLVQPIGSKEYVLRYSELQSYSSELNTLFETGIAKFKEFIENGIIEFTAETPGEKEERLYNARTTLLNIDNKNVRIGELLTVIDKQIKLIKNNTEEDLALAA